MIKAIFFATFDVNEGPKVHHQVPANSIVPSPNSPTIPLFQFSPIASYLIPHPSLSNTPLTLLTSHHRILSHPVTIPSPTYPRNAYTFNFSLVLDASSPFHSYLPVVKKLATTFRTLETTSQFLSADALSTKNTPNTSNATANNGDNSTNGPNQSRIYALISTLLEDLNNYCECMIPITASTTLNLKLFPTYPPPTPLYAWHVPLSIVKLSTLVDDNWDLTMLRILPHIDGVNSVKRISMLADADFKLVRKAVRHLLYYGCLILLDVFSFAAVYAVGAGVEGFVGDLEAREECRRYVEVPRLGVGGGGRGGGYRDDDDGGGVSGTTLVELYLSLRQGQSVKAWCIEHAEIVRLIDIRRFITFGVIKGFLYRVHKYAIAAPKTGKGANKTVTKSEDAQITAVGGGDRDRDRELGGFLDGTHCFDEICTELMCSEKELLARLKSWGDVLVICR